MVHTQTFRTHHGLDLDPDLDNSDLIWTESLNDLKSIYASGVIHWTGKSLFHIAGC